MKLAIVFWTILYLSLLSFGLVSCKRSDLVISLTKHGSHHVSIITNLPQEHYSSMPTYIIHQEIMNEFPTILINTKAITKRLNGTYHSITNSHTTNDIFKQNILKIIFLDVMFKNTTQELSRVLKLLRDSTVNRVPSKCAIILTNSNSNTDFQEFFRYSWVNNYLYVTIIEYLETQEQEKYFFFGKDYHRMVVHQYNPFNDSYKSDNFSVATELFSNKLLDLQGMRLNTGRTSGMGDDGNNALDNIFYGLSCEVMRTLTKALNFSINIHTINSRSETNIAKLGDIRVALENGTIDFWYTFVNWKGCHYKNKTGCLYGQKLGIFLYPHPNCILVKQYGNIKLHIPFNTLILNAVLTITCIIILILIRKFDAKAWTLQNIMKILMGGSVTSEPQKISERIFFLYLTFIYIIFSVQVIDSLYQKTYSELASLKEMVNAGIVPFLLNHTRRKLGKREDSVLQQLSENSETLADYRDMSDCVIALLNDANRTVNGCEIPKMIGIDIQKHFRGNKKERLISLIEQPLIPRWATIMHAPTSHYVKRFDNVVRRLDESGLVNFWMQNYTEVFLSSLKKSLNSTNDEEPMNNKREGFIMEIVFRLGIGYSVSCFVFLCEIVWSRLKIWRMTPKRINRIR